MVGNWVVTPGEDTALLLRSLGTDFFESIGLYLKDGLEIARLYQEDDLEMIACELH